MLSSIFSGDIRGVTLPKANPSFYSPQSMSDLFLLHKYRKMFVQEFTNHANTNISIAGIMAIVSPRFYDSLLQMPAIDFMILQRTNKTIGV